MREPAATVSTADHAGLEQLDARAGGDVALDLAAHHHRGGVHLPGDVRALLDGDVALHVHIALEAAGDAHVTGALDLALDGDVGGDQRFLGRTRRRGLTGGNRRR